MKLDKLRGYKLVSEVARWLHVFIAVGPIAFYRFDLPWQYWICVLVFTLLWIEVWPSSGVMAKLQISLAEVHVGLAWAVCISAFLGCVSFGWNRETEFTPKLTVAIVILIVAGLLTGRKIDKSDE